MQLIEQVVDPKVGSVDIKPMPRASGLVGLPKHFIVGDPISQLENLVEEFVVRKVKFLHMKGRAEQ